MSDPVVNLQSGSIRGTLEDHEDGFRYYAFKGIPFAEAPIGELRFEDPVAKKPWTGVMDCRQYVPMLMQYDFYQYTSSFNEDGLHLNVFTREIDQPNANKPVMMVIHGGAYICFSGDDCYNGPEYLIRKDLVIVTINYRLGVLGFLNLEDEIAPGNQGLKDQVLALQWIQQNIRAFGGDENNVTVYGTSAGASAAHYLAISPMTKGLMHKVISQSSVAFNPWTTVTNPRSKAIQLCSLLGRELTDSREIVDFLKGVDTAALQEAQEKLREAIDQFPFGPGVDSKSTNPFLSVEPAIAANQPVHLPYLVGYSAREGLILLIDNLTFKGEPRQVVFEKKDQNHKLFFGYNGQHVLDRHGLHETQVKRLYYKGAKVSCQNTDCFVDLMSEVFFVEGIQRFCRVQAEGSTASTYLFVFDYDSPNLISKKVLNDTPGGVSHMDDSPYVMKMKFFERLGIEHFKKGSKDYRIMDQMTEMWSNFARYGRPTVGTSELIPVDWLPIADGTLLRYLSIDEDLLMKSTVNVDQKFLSAKGIPIQ